MAKNAVHCGYYIIIILLWSRFTSLLDLLKLENWTEQTLLTLQRLDVRYIWCANKAPSIHNDIFFLRFRKNTRPHPSQSLLISNNILCMTSLYSETSESGALDFSILRVQSPKSDQHQIFSLWYQCFENQWSWELQTWSHKMNLLDILSTSPH